MSKTVLSSMLALLSCGCFGSEHTAQKSLAGRWEGVAEFSGKTKVTVDFNQDSNGFISAAISVPDERLLSKPLINVSAESRVHFELQATERRIIFDGIRNNDVISGTVQGGEVRAPLSLRRMGEVPPTPYAQEEVRFHNGDVSLAGTLLIPPTKGRHPALVLIHGSSTPSRNDFRFYGDLFARHGIAALIYDKRDVGGDLGGASRVDLRDLAGDALAAVELLSLRDDVNPQQIGVWGHSQGGWVAPIAAAASKHVAFVISFSGPGVAYAEVDTFADATRLRAHGFSEADIKKVKEAHARVAEYVRQGGNEQALQLFLDQTFQKPWAAQTTVPRRVPSPDEIRSWLAWRDLDLDPVNYWSQITVPSLVLFGELDDVVPVQTSAERIEAALKRAGNKDVTIRIFPGANHTIQPAPDFLDTMVAWTMQRVTIVK